jgi:hypothetical protein
MDNVATIRPGQIGRVHDLAPRRARVVLTASSHHRLYVVRFQKANVSQLRELDQPFESFVRHLPHYRDVGPHVRVTLDLRNDDAIDVTVVLSLATGMNASDELRTLRWIAGTDYSRPDAAQLLEVTEAGFARDYNGRIVITAPGWARLAELERVPAAAFG